jgi:hypothetical protein
MKSLYTAVGRFERRTGENGRYPVIIVNRKEYAVDIPEMIVWTCCCWRILELPQIGELYSQMAGEAGIDGNISYESCVKRLVRRGLIASGIGETGADALYDLLSGLYIVPVAGSLLVKITAFLKFIFINRLPLKKAVTVFKNERLSDREKRVIDLARQTGLSTAELIKCVETGVYDLSSDDKVMEAIYNDDETTCDNIPYYAKLLREQQPVLETVANLYLRKLIIFERF